MHDFVFYNHHLCNQFLCLEKEALSLLRDCTLPALRNFKAFITLWSSLIEELSFPSYFLISEVLISWVQGTLHKIVLKDEVYCCNHESPLARHKMLRFLQGHPDPTSFQKSPHPHSHVSLGYGILNYHNLFFFFFLCCYSWNLGEFRWAVLQRANPLRQVGGVILEQEQQVASNKLHPIDNLSAFSQDTTLSSLEQWWSNVFAHIPLKILG